MKVVTNYIDIEVNTYNEFKSKFEHTAVSDQWSKERKYSKDCTMILNATIGVFNDELKLVKIFEPFTNEIKYIKFEV